jgi:hypothetical protein
MRLGSAVRCNDPLDSALSICSVLAIFVLVVLAFFVVTQHSILRTQSEAWPSHGGWDRMCGHPGDTRY